MARRKKKSKDGFWLVLPWALLLSWMFSPAAFVLLVIILLILVGVTIYLFLNKD
jgi:hypothetical protein